MKNKAGEEISRAVSKPAVRICREDMIGRKNTSGLHHFKAISCFSSPYFCLVNISEAHAWASASAWSLV